MSGYQYCPELKKPGPLNSIDFGNPALAPMVRLVVQNLQQTVREYRPPEGLALQRISIPSWDGKSIDCLVTGAEGDAPLPGMLYCHGGGFFLPLQTAALNLAAFYAQKLQMRVFLPEYRILPEYANPYPFKDCYAVWRLMNEQGRDHGLDGRILLYGESAGGALAAGLAQYLRDRGESPALGQLLIYPVLDHRSERYPSVEQYSGAVWTKRSNDYMWSNYLRDGEQGMEPYVVPMKAEDLSRLPPAYVEPQGIDILRDEGVLYAERLRSAEVPVELNLIEGSYHGFDSDMENPFVQKVLAQRMKAMADMLEAAGQRE